MFKINEILKYLSTCKAYRPSEAPTPVEKKFRSAGKFLSRIAIGVLVLGTALGIFHKFVHQLPPTAAGMAELLMLSGILLVFVKLVVEVLAIIVSLKHWNADTLDHDIEMVAHDERLAMHLTVYTREQLLYADSRVEQRLGRIERRVAAIFGEKVALVGVLAVLIGAVKGIGELPILSAQLGFTMHSNAPLYLVVFFLGGLASMPLIVRAMAGRYVYQRQLIAHAMQIQEILLKSEGESLAVNAEVPILAAGGEYPIGAESFAA